MAPSGTVALVFTDIQGSTRLWERRSADMRAALEVHDGVLRGLLGRTAGYEVKAQGDGFMLAFPSVLEAVRWCLRAQEALLRAPWPPALRAEPDAAEERGEGGVLHQGLRVRMGVHVGQPERREEAGSGRVDYFGRVVNQAARVADAGHGGQVLLSGEAWAQVRDAREALGWPEVRALGAFGLKGLEAPVELVQVLPASLAGRRFGPLRVARQQRGNLGPAPDALVGREQELALLAQWLREGTRLVTVLGPGGMGKTRLATHLGILQQEAGAWEGGVWLCELAEATCEDDVCHALARALGVVLAHGGEEGEAAAQLGRALAGRGPVLVLLDNLEQVVRHAPATVGRWLAQAPQARLLVTSREALGLRGERVLELGPLGLPAEDEVCPEALARAEAVRLFVQRARAVQGDFTLAPEEVPQVAQICRRLDGIALAIELAAARTRVLGVAQLCERLSRRFELLRCGRRDASARQATLRGAIDWSWRLLEPVERQALARCSVFRGGFTPQAAEAVLALPEDGPDALEVLHSLRGKSLLRASAPDGLPGERRLGMYESIREYAAARLAEEGGGEEAVARHAEHYLSLARALCQQVHGRGGVEALRRLTLERENLLAVCDNALARVAHGPRWRAWALEALVALEPEVAARGPVGLTLERLGRALAADGEVDGRLRAEALAVRGRLHLEAGHVAAARGDLEAARQAFEALGDAAREKRAWVALSMVARHEGDLGSAWRCMERARALPSRGDGWLEAYTLGNLGLVELYRSGAAAALGHLRAALELFREVGDRAFEAAFLTNYGLAVGEVGRTREAVALLEEALSTASEAGARVDYAVARANIGCLLLEEGRAGEALEHLRAAQDIGRAMGIRVLEAGARGELGRAHLALGALEVARRHLQEAIGVLSEVSRWHTLRFTAHLAAVQAALGLRQQAREAFEALEAAPEVAGDAVLRELASLLRAAEDVAEARAAGEGSPAGRGALEAARERLERARAAAAASSDLRGALRLLEGWLAARG